MGSILSFLSGLFAVIKAVIARGERLAAENNGRTQASTEGLLKERDDVLERQRTEREVAGLPSTDLDSRLTPWLRD